MWRRASVPVSAKTTRDFTFSLSIDLESDPALPPIGHIVIGKTISHYSVVESLGAGGMGVVYRAHDLHLDRDVAIKVLPTNLPRSESARLRFRREALAASAL